MSRLIDADAFKDYCHSYFNGKNDYALRLIKKEYGTILDVSMRNFISGIDELPTVEAEPIRHGEWMEQDENDTCLRQTCSECGKKFRVCGEVCGKDNREVAFYCPGCGARMDGAKCG